MDKSQFQETIADETKFRMHVIQTLSIIEGKLSKLEEQIDSVEKDVDRIINELNDG